MRTHITTHDLRHACAGAQNAFLTAFPSGRAAITGANFLRYLRARERTASYVALGDADFITGSPQKTDVLRKYGCPVPNTRATRRVLLAYLRRRRTLRCDWRST